MQIQYLEKICEGSKSVCKIVKLVFFFAEVLGMLGFFFFIWRESFPGSSDDSFSWIGGQVPLGPRFLGQYFGALDC